VTVGTTSVVHRPDRPPAARRPGWLGPRPTAGRTGREVRASDPTTSLYRTSRVVRPGVAGPVPGGRNAREGAPGAGHDLPVPSGIDRDGRRVTASPAEDDDRHTGSTDTLGRVRRIGAATRRASFRRGPDGGDGPSASPASAVLTGRRTSVPPLAGGPPGRRSTASARTVPMAGGRVLKKCPLHEARCPGGPARAPGASLRSATLRPSTVSLPVASLAGQPAARAASTTSRASARMRSRCSSPWKLSA
jgi:hypothetical protein